MAADVTLVIKANTDQYTPKIKEAAKETQKLTDTANEGAKRRLGYIEMEEKRIQLLTEKRRKSYTTTNIEFYNKELERAKKNIENLEKAGTDLNDKSEKSSKNMVASIGRMAAAYLTVRTAVIVLKETVLAFFTRSQEGIELLERKFAGFKASVSVLQGEFIKLGKSLVGEQGDTATPWGDRLVKGLKLIATTANLIPGVTKYFDDLGKKMNEAGAAAEEYTRINQELEYAERNMIVPRAEANLAIREARLLYADTTKSINERIKALETALALENKVAEEEIKHAQFVILNIRNQNEEKKKAGKLMNEDLLKLQQALAHEIDLRTESVGRQIRATNSLMAARKELMGEDVKDTEEYYIQLRDSFFDYIDDINKAKEGRWEFDLKTGELLFKQNQEQAKRDWDLLLENNKKQEEADEELLKNKKEALQKLAEEFLNYFAVLQEITDKEVERTERERELLDTRISETQDAINTEIQLYEAGYASNVAGKQRELEELKRLREQALKDEEEAIKKQRQLDSLVQVSGLITASADIFKSFSKIPVVGIPLAIGMIATMFAAFAAVKAQAAEAAKYAKGGWTGEGSQRDETGERMAGIVHEKEFVVRRGPAHKFREVLEAINREDKLAVYNSFNRMQPELLGGTTNITVENNGPNNRLDRINNQLHQLNQIMQPKKRNIEEILRNGNQIVYRKGNSIRIVR